MNALNTFLFVAFPYVAVMVFVVGVVYRYRQKGFTVSSLSSQFLEGKTLFWGSIPFHLGILVVFFWPPLHQARARSFSHLQPTSLAVSIGLPTCRACPR
ncbi:MAG: respiratory nitrate reductase subunit gamma [Gemmatimonadetes bacterium]|nr:respiratory nitrate reductase subunit gamma [Gemmatimonadota bacterium]